MDPEDQRFSKIRIELLVNLFPIKYLNMFKKYLPTMFKSAM
jgi:hypothetical protein